MANIISIGHLKLTPADMRAIFDHADALIAEEIVGEVTSRPH